MTNDKLINPATKFPEWKKTEFVVWDKEKKENVGLKMPLEFSVIKVCTTIKGYNNVLKKGIFSNEVDNVSKEPLNVRYHVEKGAGEHSIGTGMWMSLKDEVKKAGGRYCSAVYVMHEGELKCFNLMGSALAAFIQGKDHIDLENSMFKVTLGDPITTTIEEDGEKKEITYTPPKMEYLRNLEGDEYDRKIDITAELSKYHRKYQEKNAVKPQEETEKELDAIPAIEYKSDIDVSKLPF